VSDLTDESTAAPAFPRPLAGFSTASFVAVVLGAVVCAMSGVAAGLWARNLAAWGFGALAAVAVARWGGERFGRGLALAAPLGLCLTFLGPDLDGVHRWLVAGPVRFNSAMLLLPSLVVATAILAKRHRWWWTPAFGALALLTLQPDASQTSAMALAICVIAAGLRSRPWAERIAVAIAALLFAALSWTRPDPLQPVPEVEGVIRLAGSHSPVLAGLAVLSLIAFAAAPSLAIYDRRPERGLAGVALTALLSGWVVAPALGAFPVPLIGMGVSPILGAWIGVGLLASLRRWESAANGASR
jgi:cell division protein FtsW (lipid II flippase)